MADLRFHLHAVIKTKDQPADFDGPLSLILQLLSRNKVEIQDIQISQITDQYLRYLSEMERMDLEIAGEFIMMASYLLFLKAKTLLEGTQAVEEVESLISSLEEQQRRETLERMKEAAVWLSEQRARGEGQFVRQPQPLTGQPEYCHVHKPEELTAALLDVLGRERGRPEEPMQYTLPARIPYSIDEKTEELLLRLRDSGPVALRQLFRESADRSETVATLLAVLELYHAEKLSLEDTEAGLILTPYR